MVRPSFTPALISANAFSYTAFKVVCSTIFNDFRIGTPAESIVENTLLMRARMIFLFRSPNTGISSLS